jgi:hypothetical protein
MQMVQVQMQTSFGAPKPSAHCDMKVSGHGSSEKLLQGSSVASMHPVVSCLVLIVPPTNQQGELLPVLAIFALMITLMMHGKYK